MPSSAAMASATSCWCYRCSRFIRFSASSPLICPTCNTGFLEELDFPPPSISDAPLRRNRQRRRPSSPFNPVIVLRSPSISIPDRADADHRAPGNFRLYYDDGAGSGIRPLPPSMSEFLMVSGFGRLLEQFAGSNGEAGVLPGNAPASKAAIESMPTIKIAAGQINMDSNCAVCMESFEVGMEVKEMPCKHVYHQDCIFPWLSMHNSCPVCRHEMQGELSMEVNGNEPVAAGGGEEEEVGLSIWRLPGGGFAVGRFSGEMGAAARELPVVYTEMDGGSNARGSPRRISWNGRGSREREHGWIGRACRSFLSIFGCFGSHWPSAPSSSGSSTRASILNSSRRRRLSSWALQDGNGIEISRW